MVQKWIMCVKNVPTTDSEKVLLRRIGPENQRSVFFEKLKKKSFSELIFPEELEK